MTWTVIVSMVMLPKKLVESSIAHHNGKHRLAKEMTSQKLGWFAVLAANLVYIF